MSNQFLPQEFLDLLDTFVKGCQEIVNEYWERQNYNEHMEVPELSISPINSKTRYIRIVKTGKINNVVNSKSVYCFVDSTNGDVLKAATWKQPAKISRGNIYDKDNGLGLMTPHGAMYLR